VLEGGRPQVIANAEGSRTTPSVVGLQPEQEAAGLAQLAPAPLVLNAPQQLRQSQGGFLGRRLG